MLTKQQMLLDFIGAPATQLVIPVYQRVYAWTDRQCDTLWNDIMRAGRTGTPHFVGTVLFAPENCEGGLRRIDVIDGQQRTATITLLLTALRDHLRETGLALEGIDAEGITRRYLHIRDEVGEECTCKGGDEGKSKGDMRDNAAEAEGNTHSGAGEGAAEGRGEAANSESPQIPQGKLVLSRMDRATMAAVLEGVELPEEDNLSANVLNNYQRFRAKMGESFSADDAQTLWNGLQLLLIIAAELDESDRPQIVFESLNSKGMPLTTADLVRNLMLANVGLEEQARLYERYWAPIERLYANDPDPTRLNAALHGFLATAAPRLHVASKDDVYATFKTYLEDVHQGSLEELLIGLKGFCETFAKKSQSAGARRADAHTDWANGKVKGIISEKKLFGGE